MSRCEKNTEITTVGAGTGMRGVFTYDLISFQASLIRDLTAEARIVGSNSVSALLFNDKEAAVNTLTALSGFHEILGGGDRDE